MFSVSTTDFQTPTVTIQMLNSVSKEFGHLGYQRPSNQRQQKMHSDRSRCFLATVLLKYAVGPPGTAYGVLTQLGRTISGPLPNNYRQITNKNQCNSNITLFSRAKSEQRTFDEDMLQLFWPCEGTSATEISTNTIKQDDRKALHIFEDIVKHKGERYEIGLP